jgi:hypothetical protein
MQRGKEDRDAMERHMSPFHTGHAVVPSMRKETVKQG